MPGQEECLDENMILEMLQGEPGSEDRRVAEKHLASCPDCRRLVSALARTSLMPESNLPEGPSAESEPKTGTTGRRWRLPVRIGDVVADKYRIDEVLGRGGMGAVVAATHLHLGHRVALKFLLAEIADDPSAVRRFLQEARASVRIESEHVARVLDVGSLPQGDPYLVMECLRGTDLGQVLRERGPLAVGDAVHYIVQACEGVAEAHRLQIIHRDLKPSNLFLVRTSSGTAKVKVLDFGLAKVFDAEIGASLRTTSAGVIGSPSYMSPEQMTRPRDVDVRTDIWSMGIALYELLAGRLPFSGETLASMIAAVQTADPIPLRKCRGDVPDALAGIIERCLQKDREARWATIDQLSDALAPFAATRTSVPSLQGVEEAVCSAADAPAPRSYIGEHDLPLVRTARWYVVAAVLALALAGLAGGVIAVRNRASDRMPATGMSLTAIDSGAPLAPHDSDGPLAVQSSQPPEAAPALPGASSPLRGSKAAKSDGHQAGHSVVAASARPPNTADSPVPTTDLPPPADPPPPTPVITQQTVTAPRTNPAGAPDMHHGGLEQRK